MAGSGKIHLRDTGDTLLQAESLVVEFPVGKSGLKVHAVSDVSLDVKPGETLGLVGESGCGKSTTGRALMQLPAPTSGSVRYAGRELTDLHGDDLRRVRPEMQMIFQDPISSLNPRRKVGDIVAEPLRIWAGDMHPAGGSIRAVVALLRLLAGLMWAAFAALVLMWIVNVTIPYLLNVDGFLPESFWQGVRSAGGTISVSALTFGIAAFILSRYVRDRVDRSQWATVAFSVLLALATLVGFATLPALGRVLAVQTATSSEMFEPSPEWTDQQILEGIDTVITIDGNQVTVSYAGADNGRPRAGGGSGTIAPWVEGVELALLVGGIALALLPGVLVMLPGSVSDYRKMVEIRVGHDTKVRETLENVGLDPDAAMGRRPHQFSGGQCQRICIARALVLDPKVIICDEPVSALDVSVQAQILNLLEAMKKRYDLTLVFIAHDLAVVKNVSDRVAVMYLGKICEVAGPDDLYARPAHPYTAALLASIPVPDPAMRPRQDNILGGEIPSPVAPPSGCRFRTRCPRAEDMCAQVEPTMRQIDLGHYVACHFPLEANERKAGGKAMAARAAKAVS